jgi:tetratricopeptide (TPR) repeat protein
MIDIPRDDLVLMLEAGYIYLAMGKFTEARQIFEGLTALAPKHDVPRVALANVLFAQKKFLPAIRTLKEAIKINKESAFAHAHLGEALLFYGKKELALESLQEALRLDPKGKCGDFARSLTELINQGYSPLQYREEAKKGKALAQ